MFEKTIFVDNLKINYKVAGEGPAVLVLHGWGGSSDSWLKVQDILAQKGYMVIVPDLPGFGKSLTPFKPWGLKDYSNFVLKLTEKLKISDFFLVGHSFGGRIAVKISVEKPGKIKRLILSDSAGIKPKPGLKTKVIFQLANIGNTIFSPRHLVRFKDKARNSFYIFLRHKDYAKANGVMKETIKKVLDEDLLPDLSKMRTGTLIVWGEKDKIVPVKYAYVFKESIADSEVIILPKVGHSPHLETPEKLSEIILDFINR